MGNSSIFLSIPNLHPLFYSHKSNCLWTSDLKKEKEKQEPDQREIIKSIQHSDTMSK